MTTISAVDKAKQDAARENDGKFGTQLHGEPEGGTGVLAGFPAPASVAVLNIPAARVKVESYNGNLPEWPEGYPKPEVSWEFEDGKPKTRVTVGDEGEVWTLHTDDEGHVHRNSRLSDSLFAGDYDAQDAAAEWAEEVHKRIDEAAYSVSLDTAGSVGVNASILKFATTDNQGVLEPEPKTPVAGPKFDALMAGLEQAFDDARDRMQHGYMLRAVSEMKAECPSVASFKLSAERHLEVGEIVDADGNDVSPEEAEALYMIFRYREEADYTNYLEETVDVEEIIASWK